MKKKTVGSNIVSRLKTFNKAVSDGKKISEQFTCYRVILDLNPRDYTAEMVKKTRKRLHLSQSLFAQFIGVSPGAVKSWEQGTNPVPGIACRIMDEINLRPSYWRKRVNESIVDKHMV